MALRKKAGRGLYIWRRLADSIAFISVALVYRDIVPKGKGQALLTMWRSLSTIIKDGMVQIPKRRFPILIFTRY